MCRQFQSSLPCKVDEARCTFAHNDIEAHLWMLDRDQQFDMAAFVQEWRKIVTGRRECRTQKATGQARLSQLLEKYHKWKDAVCTIIIYI